MARKSLGQAANEAEKVLEAAIASVPQWKGKTADYEPVAGGISNANWRVFIAQDQRSYFVKVPGQGTEMFIDREAAHDASVKAHTAGVGPQVIHFDPTSGIEVFVFIEGLRPPPMVTF